MRECIERISTNIEQNKGKKDNLHETWMHMYNDRRRRHTMCPAGIFGREHEYSQYSMPNSQLIKVGNVHILFDNLKLAEALDLDYIKFEFGQPFSFLVIFNSIDIVMMCGLWCDYDLDNVK